MAKRKLTRADFAGLRMLRPERSASPVRRSIGDMTTEEYYYYYGKDDDPYGYYEGWYDYYDDPYWWQEGDPYWSWYDEYYGMEDLKDGVYIKDDWGCHIDSSLSAEEYYEKYMQTHPAKDPARNGGVPVDLNKDALEKCGFTVEAATSYPNPSEGTCIIVYHTGGQMWHAVIWKNTKVVDGEKFYIVVDPSQYVNYPNDGDKYAYEVSYKDVAQVWKITK